MLEAKVVEQSGMLTRGSRTAAEKVVRESESLDMGSPDKREAIPPVDDVEDSPVFKYLCNLSPIKPAKPMHHAQTYNELTFPPEPRIFASPRTSRRTSNSSLKRVVAAEGWHQSNSRSTMTDNAPSPSPHVGTPCSRRQEGEEVPQASTKNENESFTVDELVGQGMFAMNPNPEQLQSQFTGFDQSEPVEKGSTDNRRQSTASSLSQDHQIQQSSKCPEEPKAPELDHETTAMAYFLAGNETLEQDPSEWSEDSSDVCALSEEAEKQDSDLLETMASESGLDLSAHNNATENVDTAGQRGFRRRCLDFDASGARRRSLGSKKVTGSRLKECSGTTVVINNDESPVLGNVIPDSTASRLEDNPPNANGDTLKDMTKVQQQLPNENNVDVLNGKAAEVQTQKQPIIPPEGVRRSPRVRRTGIGLHLNSLTTTMSFKRETGGESTTKRVLATSLGLQQPPPKETDHPAVPRISTPEDVPAVPDFTSLNIDNLPPLEESLALTPIPNLPRLVSPRGQKRSLSHQQSGEEDATDDLLESPQSSKRRRLSRRKPPPPSQGEKPSDGCKRCNCKKSKCLKLYCECFAAGVYCVGSCACRHCFNKPEYEDTVRNTRLQIESRNPLAFAPKIVQGAEASPVPGDEAQDTPASARHKRGCNCKKSLCLKKYCECFQAGVGCSEGCRCEGCKNMFGKKEGPAEGEEKEAERAISSREESSQVEDPVELFSRMNGNPGRLRQDCAKPNLSPITPTFEQDGHGRSMLRLRSTGRKRISSDEHCAASSPLAPQVSSKPPKSPTSFANTLDSFDLVPQGDSDLSINGSAGETTPTFARINHVSPRWGEGLTDLCSLTPMPMTTTTSLQPTPGSCVTSERPGASPAFRTESPSSTRASSRAWSSHSPTFRQPAPRSPLRFNSPATQIAGKSLQKELESVKDDDTLEFLNYQNDNNNAALEEMSSPSRSCTVTTKSSSPKQKRVTPPRQTEHFQQQQPFPSSPAGLRNSKRFILQALPPVPHSQFPNG